jgi:hypothetical protein
LSDVYACILPIRELFADRERESRQLRTSLSRLQAVTAREVPAAKEMSVGEGEFLTGKTDGAISADLQTRLKQWSRQPAASCGRSAICKPKSDGHTRYVGSHVEVFGPLRRYSGQSTPSRAPSPTCSSRARRSGIRHRSARPAPPRSPSSKPNSIGCEPRFGF